MSDIGPKPGQPERRKGGDRRRPQAESGQRVKIDPALVQGWLAFDGAGERRRLVPIPPGWFEMSDAELARLVATATVVRRRRLVE